MKDTIVGISCGLAGLAVLAITLLVIEVVARFVAFILTGVHP